MYKKKLQVRESKVLPDNLIATDFSIDLTVGNFQVMTKIPPRKKNEPRYRTFKFYCISHLIGGKGVLWHDDKMTVIHPGQAVIICPGAVHDYFGVNDYYIEDTIDFCGPLVDYLCARNLIKTGVAELGMERCLEPIINDIVSLDPETKIRAKLRFIDILLKLSTSTNESSNHEQFWRFDELIRMIYNEPERWWTVKEMAEFCNLSQVQFRRVFERHVGIQPKKFIDEVKLKAAAQKLQYTDLSIKQIADLFNYKDQFHFSRRFKSIFGVTPARYRTAQALPGVTLNH
jgi:AraC-like DNA-binding protein